MNTSPEQKPGNITKPVEQSPQLSPVDKIKARLDRAIEKYTDLYHEYEKEKLWLAEMSGAVALGAEAPPETVDNYAQQFATLKRFPDAEQARKYVEHLFKKNKLGDTIFGEQVDTLTDYQTQYLQSIEEAKKVAQEELDDHYKA